MQIPPKPKSCSTDPANTASPFPPQLPHRHLAHPTHLQPQSLNTMASKAIPSHLKPPGAGNGEAAEFARKHHGKSQSHVVSKACFHSFFSPYLDGHARVDEREREHTEHTSSPFRSNGGPMSSCTFGIESRSTWHKHRNQQVLSREYSEKARRLNGSLADLRNGDTVGSPIRARHDNQLNLMYHAQSDIDSDKLLAILNIKIARNLTISMLSCGTVYRDVTSVFRPYRKPRRGAFINESTHPSKGHLRQFISQQLQPLRFHHIPIQEPPQ